MTTPEYQYEVFQGIAKSITPADINAAFKTLWTGSAPLVHLSAKQAVPLADIGSTFAASAKVAVAAPKEVETQAFAYDSFGSPTKVIADSRVGDLGVRTVRFANNVRLNIKKTDFEAGKVRFLVRFGDGVLDLPRDKPGLGAMLGLISVPSAVSKHSLEDLKEITAGKVVTLGTGVSDDAFIAAGATTPQDLALQMKISAAYLTDPGFRPEAATKWQNAMPVIEKQLDAGPQTVAQVRLPMVLAGNDARFGIPVTSILAKRNFDEARAALKPVIADAPIEVTIVGDVDEDAVIRAVAASFGALPKREEHGSVDPAAREASFRSERTPILMTHDGPADQVLVQASWPTDDDHDYRNVIGVDMLKNVLDLLLTDSVREKLGDSYGVAVQSLMSNTFKGFGYLSASAIVAPDKAEEVEKAYEEAAAELRDKPVSADLLARARNPELERIDRSLRENGYWLGAIARAQSEPDRLQRIRERKAIVEAITPEGLQKLAVQYLQPRSLQLVRIVSSRSAAKATPTAAR